MASRARRQRRQDRTQSPAPQASPEERGYDSDSSDSLADYFACARELERGSGGVQVQRTSQRINYYAPNPAPVPAPIPAPVPAPILPPNTPPNPPPVPAPIPAPHPVPIQAGTHRGRRILLIGGLIVIAGVVVYNLHTAQLYPMPDPRPLLANVVGFRTRSGQSPVQEVEHGAQMLSDMHRLATNSTHDMRDQLLRHIHEAQTSGQRALESSQVFHRLTVLCTSLISELQHELDPRSSMRAALDIVKFLTVPGSPPPHRLVGPLLWSAVLDQAIRGGVLEPGNHLRNVWEAVIASAHQYRRDVDAWAGSVARIDAAIGQSLPRYASLKGEIAKAFRYFTRNDQEEARLQNARQTDEHILQMRETDILLCRATKHLRQVQQGSRAAVSYVQSVYGELSDWLRDCSTGGTCPTIPDRLRLLGATDEEVATYWEEGQHQEVAESGEGAKWWEDAIDAEGGYVRCVVM
ncbi:MAG: hypothetical protein Q9206_006219 [Seirophora lacunosa]